MQLQFFVVSLSHETNARRFVSVFASLSPFSSDRWEYISHSSFQKMSYYNRVKIAMRQSVIPAIIFLEKCKNSFFVSKSVREWATSYVGVDRKNSGISILPLPGQFLVLRMGNYPWRRMNCKLANGMNMWKGNGNTTTLLFSLKRLEIVHQERRGQVKTIIIEHFNGILFHKFGPANK